jgi:hypothetical protein
MSDVLEEAGWEGQPAPSFPGNMVFLRTAGLDEIA